MFQFGPSNALGPNLHLCSVVSIASASASESGGCGQAVDTSLQPLGPGGVTGEAQDDETLPGGVTH